MYSTLLDKNQESGQKLFPIRTRVIMPLKWHDIPQKNSHTLLDMWFKGFCHWAMYHRDISDQSWVTNFRTPCSYSYSVVTNPPRKCQKRVGYAKIEKVPYLKQLLEQLSPVGVNFPLLCLISAMFKLMWWNFEIKIQSGMTRQKFTTLARPRLLFKSHFYRSQSRLKWLYFLIFKSCFMICRMIVICRSLSLKKSNHFNDVFQEILHHFYR